MRISSNSHGFVERMNSGSRTTNETGTFRTYGTDNDQRKRADLSPIDLCALVCLHTLGSTACMIIPSKRWQVRAAMSMDRLGGLTKPQTFPMISQIAGSDQRGQNVVM